MIRNSRVYIADVMDEVVVEATVWTLDRDADSLVEATTYRAQMKSVGEDVPHEWLKEALICLIETL